MKLFQTVLSFLIAIGLIVLIHELGHYLLARLCNVKVLRFSVGIGKVLYSRRFGKDQTEWAISLLPIGGYVKMLDSSEQDASGLSDEDLKREFNNQNVWRRIAIVLAGPVANFLLGILILAGVSMHGVHSPSTKLRTVHEKTVAWQAGLRGGEFIVAVNGEPVRIWPELRWELAQAVMSGQAISLAVCNSLEHYLCQSTRRTVMLSEALVKKQVLERHFVRKLGFDYARPPAILGEIQPGGPADIAGLKAGDRVIALNNRKVVDSLAFVEMIRQLHDKQIVVDVLRFGYKMRFDVTPLAAFENGEQVGKIMAQVSLQPEMALIQEPFFAAVSSAFARTWETINVSLKSIGMMVMGDMPIKSVSGPIAIADYAGQTARLGIVNYLSFLAFVSISIGVMNLLPIPVLDGGLLMYYSMELLTGKKASERAVKIAQKIGMAILLTLTIFAIFNDVMRLAF